MAFEDLLAALERDYEVRGLHSLASLRSHLKHVRRYFANDKALAITTLGLEATPPLGRQDRWEVEPFLAFGWSPHEVVTIQGQIVGRWEEQEGIAGFEYRLGVAKDLGRVVPMVEAGWVVPRSGERTLSFYPQMWIQLSRLGHVAGSIGAELPAVGPEPRRPKLIAFLLWDFGDAGLFKGW